MVTCSTVVVKNNECEDVLKSNEVVSIKKRIRREYDICKYFKPVSRILKEFEGR